ncbi:acyl-CoA carboxylase subunit epsilon [Arthrobacter sp. JCM 19049]|uniref:acyl-CoA carboxylase subunit epsilon n=1 Tax=Arthrobacter sp. JCM 19049 TaxID=1460643 RepID=UPI0006D0E9F8|nr:acyl-CoA carboxylase subunit epsilon [Arthrobacter sp. JCM 19049]
MEQHTATRQATAALTVTRGNPSPEELAAVTALLSAMAPSRTRTVPRRPRPDGSPGSASAAR